MIQPPIYGIVSGLMFLTLGGCRDAKPRTENASKSPSDQCGIEPRQVLEQLCKRNTGAGPADVVRRYYDSIGKGQYDSAYALWERSGKASGKTRAEFARGFNQTARTIASVGDSVRVEGAAGSQYATVPVTVDATLRDGTRQHYVGTYTVRRAMVDGATAEQRSWHIYSADLR